MYKWVIEKLMVIKPFDLFDACLLLFFFFSLNHLLWNLEVHSRVYKRWHHWPLQRLLRLREILSSKGFRICKRGYYGGLPQSAKYLSADKLSFWFMGTIISGLLSLSFFANMWVLFISTSWYPLINVRCSATISFIWRGMGNFTKKKVIYLNKCKQYSIKYGN